MSGYNCNCNSSNRSPEVESLFQKRLQERQEQRVERENKQAFRNSLFLGLFAVGTELVASGKINFDIDLESNNRAPEDVKADIDKVLNSIESASISEAELKLAESQKQEVELKKSIKASEYKINIYENQNNNLAQRNKELYSINNLLDTDIQNLRNQIEELNEERMVAPQMGPNNDLFVFYTMQITTLEKEIKEKEAQKEKNMQEIKGNSERIEENNSEIEKLGLSITSANEQLDILSANINTYSEAVKNLHKLERQLKRAEKEEAEKSLANYQNEDVDNVTDIIKKIKNAKTLGLSKNSDKLKQEAIDAIYNYYKTHNVGDNKTIDNLAKSFGFNLDNINNSKNPKLDI